jgi:hypothetical protein
MTFSACTGLLTAFLLMIVIGSLTFRGNPTQQQPGPLPAAASWGAGHVCDRGRVLQAGASAQLIGAGIFGSGSTAFAAPVLSPLVTATLAAVSGAGSGRRCMNILETPSGQ